MSTAARHARPSLATLIVTSVLSAIFLFAAASVVGPSDVLGATVTKVARCSANLRTSASVNARVRKVIPTATKVSVVTSVNGGSWRTTCLGKTTSGKTWYRISAINGKSVKSIFGVTYLYAATSLFKAYVPPPVTKYAACRAYLRTSPSTTAPAKTTIALDTKVLVATSVAGTAWSTTCAGKAVAGSAWYRISMVSDKSVQSLHGVTYLYAAVGLFKPTPTTVASSPAPTATPTPSPTPVIVPAEPSPSPTPATSPSPAPSTTSAPTPTPTATPAPTPTPTPSAFANMTEGIDISHWQGTIDWTQVAGAGKRFAYMKASESTTYVDPTYASNRQEARAAGLLVGAYHFAQPSATIGDGAAQADHFVDTAVPVKGDLIPVLDLERTGSLSQAALTTWVKEYLERIYQRTGVRGVIYCSPNFWKTYLGDTTWFAANGYDILWIAHWTAASAPTLPGGGWGGNGWTFWQYTSDGAVPGISGRVDLDRYNGTDFSRVRIP